MSIESIRQMFSEFPGAKAWLQQKAAQDHKDRQVVADERVAVFVELPAVLAAHDRKIEPLERAWDEAHAKATAAERALIAARAARLTDKHSLESKKSQLERQLERTADPSIDEALHRLNSRFYDERHTMTRVRDETRRNLMSESGRDTIRVGNQRAVQRLLDQIKAARLAFERLKLENPVDVQAAIDAIERTVNWAGIEDFDDQIDRAA